MAWEMLVYGKYENGPHGHIIHHGEGSIPHYGREYAIIVNEIREAEAGFLSGNPNRYVRVWGVQVKLFGTWKLNFFNADDRLVVWAE